MILYYQCLKLTFEKMAQTNDDDLLILSDETTGVDENKITDNLTELLNTDNVVS
jgi:hypothetical protein